MVVDRQIRLPRLLGARYLGVGTAAATTVTRRSKASTRGFDNAAGRSTWRRAMAFAALAPRRS